MARALFYLLLLAAGIGLCVAAAFRPQLWEPWLSGFGMARGEPPFDLLVRGFVVAVVGIPVYGLIHAVSHLGADRGTTDIHGYSVLRLRAGFRTFVLVGAIGGAALFATASALGPGMGPTLAYQAGAVLLLVFAVVTVTARVRYDGRSVAVYSLVRGWRQHEWADLEDVREVPELRSTLLLFRNGQKAAISHRYAGIAALRETAKARLEPHARTSGGRDRQARP